MRCTLLAQVTTAKELSIVAQQRGDRFAPYETDAGGTILLVRALRSAVGALHSQQ